MNRRNFLQTVGLAGAALTVAPGTYAWASNTLCILHTNDMHSRIDPFPGNAARWAGLGGMARRAALIKRIRSEQPHVLLLDSGDIFQGTPYFNYYGGELELRLMSKMGYDAATIGNHDFDNGIGGLLGMMPHAKFPFLNVNYDFRKTGLEQKVLPYTIIKRGPATVGIYGLGIELNGLVGTETAGAIGYTNPLQPAHDTAKLLRQKGCNLVVCLSHIGYKYDSDKVSDRVLAAQLTGTDLILGGHTHTFLDKPDTLTAPDGRPVILNQTGWAGVNVGRIDYAFSRGGTIKHISHANLPVGGALVGAEKIWEG